MQRSLILALAALLITACSAEPRPIRVAAVSPYDGATGVAPTAPITVTFDGDVDGATVAGKLTLTRNAAPVDGEARYNRNLREASFVPDAPLPDGTYTASMTGEVRGAAGEPVDADRSWSFSVSAAAQPEPQPPVATTPLPLPTLAFLSPSPGKRAAGIVDVEVDLEAAAGIQRAELFLERDGSSVRVDRLEPSPAAAPVERASLSSSVSTVDFEVGEYTFRAVLTDRAGNMVERALDVVFLTPFIITTPEDGDTIGGGGRQIVAITIGVNGTIVDDYDVTSVDLFVNGGTLATNVSVDADATSTRLIVYPWDTAVSTSTHPAEVAGDRVLTARVNFVDPVSGSSRSEFTPGVLLSFAPN